jgi:elongation factor Ts
MEASEASLGRYQHGTRIGVVVGLAGGTPALAKDLAMHIAASRPMCVSEADIPPDLMAREREIYVAQAAEEGKPPAVAEKIIAGRLQKKFIAEVTLLGQPFIRDPETSVAKLLAGAGASVTGFHRFEVGEGIEKKATDFAAEVMAQVRGD